MPLQRADAQRLDQADPLRQFRAEFFVPESSGRPWIYLVGNSLGLQPRRTAARIDAELQKWRTLAVRAHTSGVDPWLPYHELLSEPLATLVGARPDEVVAMNSLTTNLHLMMATFYRPEGRRRKILLEEKSFPSDHYAIETHLRWHGIDPADAMVYWCTPPGETELQVDQLETLLAEHRHELALVILPGVQYYTGQLLEIPAITGLARREGVPIGWDLAHAVGNVELQLHDWEVDFAVWCSYKYLNSGPGGIAGCFVHQRHAGQTELPRLAGWWGHDKASRFEMGLDFHPIPTAEGWQLSNPPIFSLAAHRAALEVFLEAGGMRPLRAKSRQLTGFLEQRLSERLGDRVRLVTPRDPNRRGCQLSIRLQAGQAHRVQRLLQDRHVEVDYRVPDVLRAAPTPLYNSFCDVFDFVEALAECLDAVDET